MLVVVRGFCRVLPVPTGYFSQAGTPDVSSAERNRAFLRKLARIETKLPEFREFRAELTTQPTATNLGEYSASLQDGALILGLVRVRISGSAKNLATSLATHHCCMTGS